MKKVLLFVLAAFFACYTMNAQVLFSEDFENGLDNWTLYDEDGDGYDWMIYTYTGTAHGGTQSAMSASYYGGALTPDNWMVSPAITMPADASGYTLSWYAAAQDPDYPDENYAVYVATGNTVADFTDATQVLTEIIGTGDWTFRSVDLSSYAGQTIYVAFRHFNCTDQFYFKIDDVEVSKPSATPEITLVGLTLPTQVETGESFNVAGTIRNVATEALTSFDVTYSINGGANVATYSVSGINVANNGTYDFTHNVPATINAAGNATITVTVSNPNGVADITSDNTLTQTVAVCGSISTFPATQDFENGMNCWGAYAAGTENAGQMGINAGYFQYVGAHGGESAFMFSSYNSATDYAQYIVSPQLELTAAAQLSFYHKAYDSETIQIMTSTTTNDIASFTALGDEITVGASWAEATATLSSDVKYVAIKYTSEYAYFMAIDDITISVMSNDPEIALTSITSPRSVNEGGSLTVSGVVTNNSGAELTSFDVAYTFDGAASATYNVTGINVAAGQTYAFTHNAPITNITAGDHTLVVTVSNPNATADNTADNSLSISITGCSAVNAPYTETFDNGQGCWQAVDSDGDGYNWMTLSEFFPLIGYNDPEYVAYYSYGGAGDAMVSESYRSDALTADNWLISPAIVIPDDGNTYVATWYARSLSSNYLDSYSVYAGTSSDIATLSGSTPLFSGDAEAEYNQHAAVLGAYAGQTIYVAFRHNATDMLAMAIDQFEVKSVSTTPEIALTEATTNPTQVALNTAYVVNGTIVNNCATALTSFDVACTVNGQTTNQQITGINVPFLQSYSFSVDMPSIATAGDFPITVTVSNPNGVADVTTDNTQNTSINIYDASTSVPRTVLMENFTTAVCGQCPGGHDRIESAIGTTYANNVIWVSHHAGYYTDALTSTLDQTMLTFYNDGTSTYAPAVMLDRTYWGDQSFTDNDPGPVFFPNTTMADAFATATAVPAFVTVNISGVNYNATTRALSFTVSGNVTGALGTTDARLNAWLLEDGLLADGGSGVGHGPSQSGASGTFYHNHVIRENLSADDWGDAGVVNATSGNYTKTYTTTVSNNFDASKCYIVAFVSNGNHSNVNDCRVFNAGKSAYLTSEQPGPGPQPQGIDDVTANDVKLYPNPTTGNLYIEVEGLQKVEVIDAVGRVVMSQNNGNVINMSNLANGIYTVRVMANGNTAVKKVVKK